jgi:general secretion pathway protein A
MYAQFYGLAELPFNLTPDSKFLFLSKRHKEALANLMYGVQERKGFIVITGEIGSGKTTLCRTLVNELDATKTKLALILNSFLTDIELLRTINEEFGIESQFNSKKDLIDELNHFALLQNSLGCNIVIVIDEAQNLSPDCLEQIRMLGNLETEKEKLLQIVLIGQPELGETLSLPELEQLNQRVTVRYHIEPLNDEEVIQYIRHRLSVARAQAEPPAPQGEVDIEFPSPALRLIQEYSWGIPRKINLVCDRALLAGYVENTSTISDRLVRIAIAELEGRAADAESERSPARVARLESLATKILVAFVSILILSAAVAIGLILANRNLMQKTQPRASIIRQPGTTPPIALTRLNPQPPTSQITPTKPAPTLLTTASLPSGVEASSAVGSPRTSSRGGIPVSAPSPAPTPTAVPTPFIYDWVYDADKIVRVSDPNFSYQASVITWLGLWNMMVDLADMKKYDAKTIKNLDLLTFNSPIGLKKTVLRHPLANLVKYDLPLLLHVPGKDDRSPFVVLVNADGDQWTIADPVYGLRLISQKDLASAYNEAILLYFDRDDLEGVRKGEESERVKRLQEFLRRRGFYRENPSGVFDRATNRAIADFQRYYELEPTGALDTFTVAMITSRQMTGRPRIHTGPAEE